MSLKTVYYDVPNWYMAQVQVENEKRIDAKNCGSFAPHHKVLPSPLFTLTVTYGKKIWGLMKCLYEPEKPTVPTKLHPTVKDIKLSISRSKQEKHKIFVCGPNRDWPIRKCHSGTKFLLLLIALAQCMN